MATTTASATTITLPRSSNQALGLGRFAVDFMKGAVGEPAPAVLERTVRFFVDSAVCGISAIALGTNSPRVLRAEAQRYAQEGGVPIFGSGVPVAPEKAIAANAAAVREWDSNGTNFGYNPRLGHTAGEFGHNDYYAVAVAAAQKSGRDGAQALRGMVLSDEIRGRLAEVFSLKSYKIDHVLHGAIASAATYGAMLGATPEQIESAIGMVVAHYVPWRAIRAGKQLSDSKGASAALSTEAAVLSMQRAIDGFIGPADIFRNPEAVFRAFEGPGQLFVRSGQKPSSVPPADASPFDLVLTHSGEDFAVMGMHFKLGLYEHQSAGALHGLMTLLSRHPEILADPKGIRAIASIKITAYEPAYGIIGDPAKRDPHTRQSADHSMVFIVARALRKAFDAAAGEGFPPDADGAWERLMLEPADYAREAIFDERTRAIMKTIAVQHGGPEYDRRYPDGIPTSIVIRTASGQTHDSGLVMYPAGHARNTESDLDRLLEHKWRVLAALASTDPQRIIGRFQSIGRLSATQLASLYDFEILDRGTFE